MPDSRPPSAIPAAQESKPLTRTLPLFESQRSRPLSSSPILAIDRFSPSPEELAQLGSEPLGPVSTPSRAAPNRKTIRDSLPPSAPDWMQAARALSRVCEAVIEQGTASNLEQVAIARAYDAWRCGGASENHVARVAHLIARAHQALRESGRADEASALRDCAGVIHSGLPMVLKKRLTVERVIDLVAALRQVDDPWTAIVDGTVELLGWNQLGRMHAAVLIRALIERT